MDETKINTVYNSSVSSNFEYPKSFRHDWPDNYFGIGTWSCNMQNVMILLQPSTRKKQHLHHKKVTGYAKVNLIGKLTCQPLKVSK